MENCEIYISVSTRRRCSFISFEWRSVEKSYSRVRWTFFHPVSVIWSSTPREMKLRFAHKSQGRAKSWSSHMFVHLIFKFPRRFAEKNHPSNLFSFLAISLSGMLLFFWLVQWAIYRSFFLLITIIGITLPAVAWTHGFIDLNNVEV